MTSLRYRITLLEPLLATQQDGEPNSAISFSYIPGSMLRGMLIGRYLGQNGLSQAEIDSEVGTSESLIRRLFFDGAVRFLNAYPVDRVWGDEGRRMLPVPLSWYQDKVEMSRCNADALLNSGSRRQPPVHNAAAEGLESGKDWKPVTAPFYSRDHKVHLMTPAREVAVHTARSRRYGRAMPADPAGGDADGAVFRYDALAADQQFEACIVCDGTEESDLLSPLLEGDMTLGGSRSGGYGRIRLERLETDSNGWREDDSELPTGADELLVVTLLSDALIRDANGQFGAEIEAVVAIISEALGVPLIPLLQKEKTFLRGLQVGGFNRRWGLPLPQATAVRMGSVFVFGSSVWDASRLAQLEANGIGERRVEGFGRVVCSRPSEAELDVMIDSSNSETVHEPLIGAAATIAQRMTERMLRRHLNLMVTAIAARPGLQICALKSSQIARLRHAVRDALPNHVEVGRTQLENYLKSIEERQVSRRQFERAHVGSLSLLTWVRRRMLDETEIWSLLEADKLPRIGDVTAVRSSALAYEYNLRLIDAALAHAAKRQQATEE